jgi:predicted nucleotide-binding protein
MDEAELLAVLCNLDSEGKICIHRTAGSLDTINRMSYEILGPGWKRIESLKKRREPCLTGDNRGNSIMDKDQLIAQLQQLRTRLNTDIGKTFRESGLAYGHRRFDSWRSQVTQLLDSAFPGQSAKLNHILDSSGFGISDGDTDFDIWWNHQGEDADAFLLSMIQDIQNGELVPTTPAPKPTVQATTPHVEKSNRVFIVHGHDRVLRMEVARFLEKLDLKPIILDEQASKGDTVIEKIERYSDVGFAIVLYTPDDKGNAAKEAEKDILNERARQNVVFEHGYLMAKLGRSHVATLVKKQDMDLPSDIRGMVYVGEDDWQQKLAKEMKAADYPVDMNKLL